jgi:type I restriction enzyme S subunit
MSESNGLPKEWVACTLGEVAGFEMGQAPPGDACNTEGRGVLFVKAGEFGAERPVEREWTTKPLKMGRHDDVFICVVGATCGKLNLGANCAIGRSVAAIRPSECLSQKFLFYLLQPQVMALRASSAGSAQGVLNRRQLSDINICLPPLPEQHRIVEKIDELFSDLDAGVVSLQRAKANLKRYRASVLKSAVEGRLTEEWRTKHPQAEDGQMLLDRILRERREKWEKDQLQKFKEKGKEPPKNWESKYEEPSAPDTSELPEVPDGWVWATINQLNSAVRSISYGVLQPGDDLDEGVPLVRVCDVADGRVAIEQLKRIAPAISSQFQRTILQGGEVLLTVVGTIGRTAIVPNELAGANTARAVAMIAVVPPALPEFLELSLRETSMRARLTQASHEVARKTLNLEDVRIAVVPLPPLAEQEQIVSLVEERLSQIDSAENTIDAELTRAKRLRQSILKQAFEGKLVPQNPKDEPASVLLERIKASREAEQPKKKTKKLKAK